MLRGAAACNDAELRQQDTHPIVVGDPTEGALLVVAAKGGITRASIEAEMPRLETLPFDAERKRMTVIRQHHGQPWAFTKGAPEMILVRCSHLRTAQGVAVMTDSDRTRLLHASVCLAHEALRVLALAERSLPQWPLAGPCATNPEVIEQDLAFLGLIGLQDPPRPEVLDAVQQCWRAGMCTVMITGDHPDTARAIARELGILT